MSSREPPLSPIVLARILPVQALSCVPEAPALTCAPEAVAAQGLALQTVVQVPQVMVQGVANRTPRDLPPKVLRQVPVWKLGQEVAVPEKIKESARQMSRPQVVDVFCNAPVSEARTPQLSGASIPVTHQQEAACEVSEEAPWLQKLADVVNAKVNTTAEQHRVEIREYCDRLYCDLEERLTKHIVELQRDVKPQYDEDIIISQQSLIDQIEFFEQKWSCSTQLESISNEQAFPKNADMCAGPFPMNHDSPDEKVADLDANFVSRISDQVTSEVNPNFHETHQSIHGSFTKLLDMIQNAQIDLQPAAWAEKKSCLVSLSHMVMKTQKQCTSLFLELQQLRQRWNQDMFKTEVRFGKLEDALQATHDKAIPALMLTESSDTTLNDAGDLKLIELSSEASADAAKLFLSDGSLTNDVRWLAYHESA
jgi:hypothetical protein